jgi:hypothetical protein
MKKKSTIIYHDAFSIINDMPDEMAGKFSKHLFLLMEGGEVDTDDLTMKMALHPFVKQFNRDNESYKKQCEKNRLNGMKGGRPPKTQKTQVVNLKPRLTQANPKNHDKDNDKDNTIPPNVIKFSNDFYSYLSENGGKKKYTENDIKKGADTVDKLCRIDGYDLDREIRPALLWAVKDAFWGKNIQSLIPLRKKKDANSETKFSNMFGFYAASKKNGGENIGGYKFD